MTSYPIRIADSLLQFFYFYKVYIQKREIIPKKVKKNLENTLFKICDIWYRFINEDLCKKSVNRIKSGRILSEKFDISLIYSESLRTAASVRRKIIHHV